MKRRRSEVNSQERKERKASHREQIKKRSKSSYKLEEVRKEEKDAQVDVTGIILTHFLRLIDINNINNY